MAKEIERKFLVREEILTPILKDPSVQRSLLAQYYLVSTKEVAVRIRRTEDRAVLTIKSGGDGMSTNEFEFDVPTSEYLKNIADCVGSDIVKMRHLVDHNGRTWEVDVFGGDHKGLIVAELECSDAAEVTDLPDWVGEEVTYDRRYKNAVLALEGVPAVREVSDRVGFARGATSIEEQILDHMTGTHETATRELRTHSLNPFSTEANGARLVEMKESRAVLPERQKAFEEAMSRVVRADPNQIMRGEPPFDKPIDGLTEGLMFAPGDAVFTEGQPSASIPAVAIADGETSEMMAALRFTDALRNAGDDVVPMLNDLAESTLTFCAEDQRAAVDAVKYDSDEERAAAQRLVKALRAAGVDVVSMLDDLTEHAENPFYEDEPVLLAPLSPAGIFAQAKDSDESTVEGNGSVPEEGELLHVANSGHVVTVSPHAAGVADAYSGISDDLATKLMSATESHRYIDQSQEFILIGEVTDEASADLIKRAVAEGFTEYGKKED
jgi:CYTH domain-containing protein